MHIDELESDPTNFFNYHGVEDDPEAVSIIDDFVEKGWLQEYDTLDLMRADVQGEPVLNKFACIVKVKPDGTTKRRFIMDSKQSSVTAASKKMYIAVLPRLTDVISDALTLTSHLLEGEAVEATGWGRGLGVDFPIS